MAGKRLGEYVNPLSGQRGSVTDLGGLLKMIFGVFVLIVAFGAGQTLFKVFRNAAPAGVKAVIGTGLGAEAPSGPGYQVAGVNG